jgi:hypothetical protein
MCVAAPPCVQNVWNRTTDYHRSVNMKRLLFAAALAATTFPALASDVGASISIGQPGFYGRIDIGGYPQPRIIYAQPRVMYRAAMSRPPICMHVPPGHAKTGANTAVLTAPVANGSTVFRTAGMTGITFPATRRNTAMTSVTGIGESRTTSAATSKLTATISRTKA